MVFAILIIWNVFKYFSRTLFFIHICILYYRWAWDAETFPNRIECGYFATMHSIFLPGSGVLNLILCRIQVNITKRGLNLAEFGVYCAKAFLYLNSLEFAKILAWTPNSAGLRLLLIIFTWIRQRINFKYWSSQ